MDQTTTWIIVGIVLLLGISILFLFLKGLLKLVFTFAAIIAGVVSYFWLMKNGGAYLAFVTDKPAGWMVSGLSIGGAITIFLVILQGAFWISGLFSWGKMKGAGGIKGILISLMMFGVVIWLVFIGIVHFGSLADIQRYVDVAGDLKARNELPMVLKAKRFVQSSAILSPLASLDPFNDPDRVKLAKVIAYMGAEKDQTKLAACYATLDKTLPHFSRLKKISLDTVVKVYVENDDMGGILGDPKLTKILSEERMRGSLKTFDPDVLFGMKK